MQSHPDAALVLSRQVIAQPVVEDSLSLLSKGPSSDLPGNDARESPVTSRDTEECAGVLCSHRRVGDVESKAK